jgi:hypothetical protein
MIVEIYAGVMAVSGKDGGGWGEIPESLSAVGVRAVPMLGSGLAVLAALRSGAAFGVRRAGGFPPGWLV